MSSDNHENIPPGLVENQENATFNVICNVCNRIIAMDLEDKSRVDDLLEYHQEGTYCNSATVNMVKPQNPKREDPALKKKTFALSREAREKLREKAKEEDVTETNIVDALLQSEL
ncbi:MAG: hypothetical protein ABEJ56_04465 [Candidatus Nanohaloarchaea archaeon]